MNIETITTALDTLKSGLNDETALAEQEMKKLSDVIEKSRWRLITSLTDCSNEINRSLEEVQKALEAYHSDRRQAMSAMIAGPAPTPQTAE